MHDVAKDVSQAKVATGMAIGESLVIEAEQVQQRGVQVVQVYLAVDGLVAVVVRFAMDEAGVHAAASQQGAKAFLLMLAAVLGDGRGAGEILAPVRAAEFARPHHQSVL